MKSANRKGIAIFSTVVFILICLFVGPSVIRSVKINKYHGQSEARVLDITESSTDVSSYSGSGTKITAYRITYSYIVEGVSFTSTESIKPKAEAKKLLDSFSSGQSCLIVIRYKKDTPEESLISSLIID